MGFLGLNVEKSIDFQGKFVKKSVENIKICHVIILFINRLMFLLVRCDIFYVFFMVLLFNPLNLFAYGENLE